MDFLGDFVNVLLWTLWIFVFVAFIMLVVRILMDVFRDSELGGWGKTGWVILVILLPILGSLIYLIARGQGMAKRDLAEAHEIHEAQVEYTRGLVGAASGPAAEIKGAHELLASGAITQEEFDALKAKALA
jgi:hypothetical protein